MKNLSLFLAALLGAAFAIHAPAADATVKLVDKAPPAQLDAAIRAVLGGKAIQIATGDKSACEFWLCSEVPLSSRPASPPKALDGLKQATLLGAVNIPTDRRDYRDDELRAGVYTMRFALQPEDGNHLGTSEFSYFAVLTPAKLDPTPDGIATYKALVRASSKETSTEHPLILSLRPAPSDTGELPKLNVPAPEHKSVRVKVPANIAGEKSGLVFEIVFEGKGHK